MLETQRVVGNEQIFSLGFELILMPHHKLFLDRRFLDSISTHTYLQCTLCVRDVLMLSPLLVVVTYSLDNFQLTSRGRRNAKASPNDGFVHISPYEIEA